MVDGDSLAFNRVELAATELFSITIATAYHTSVLVNGEEFFFTDSGIFSDRALNSHHQKPNERVDLGYSDKTGRQLFHVLQQFFKPGTYDFLKKNCNSFSDCALYYLLGKRLDWRYAALDRLGEANMELCAKAAKGMYTPNQEAANFSAEEVVLSLGKLREDSSTEVDEDDGEKGIRGKAALSCGAQVIILGLEKATDLNGQGATITGFNPLNGRWEACLYMTGEVKAFRAENLRPAGELVFEKGDRVKIRGLRGESALSLNGQEGMVLRYMHDKSRYEVELSDDIKAVKGENLQGLTSK
jgi:hypothetical protein